MDRVELAETFNLTLVNVNNLYAFVDDFCTNSKDGGFKFTVPRECKPNCGTLDKDFKFNVMKQRLRKSTNDEMYVYDIGPRDFKNMKFKTFTEIGNKCTDIQDDDLFWRKLNTNLRPMYGVNVEAHLFDDVARPNFINVNKMDSILNKTAECFPGIHDSMLYISHAGSTFALHTEDIDLHSISYLHSGAAKVWYVVEPSEYTKVVQLLRNKFPDQLSECACFERHKFILPTPKFFNDNGIKFKKIVQEPGEYVITVSRAFHWGYNRGNSIAEASNFGSPGWITNGNDSTCCKCK